MEKLKERKKVSMKESDSSSDMERLERLKQAISKTWAKNISSPWLVCAFTICVFLLLYIVYGGPTKPYSTLASWHNRKVGFWSSEKERGDVGKQFIYVYDLGPEYTDDILKLQPAWYSIQYDPDTTVTELLTASNSYRTMDPERASLFLVPFYSARYTLFHYRDSESNMKEAVEKTSEMWFEVLHRVRQDFPYFNRSGGRDHFSFLTMDHGRCTALTYLPPAVYGEMFFLQLNGDKMVRSIHASTDRGMQALTYNYGARPDASIPDIPCYMADRDIVIPPMVNLPLRDPHKSVKNITALFRFSEGQHHGVPIPHHGHLLRKELFDLYSNQNIPGWDFNVKSESDTNDEWQNAVFCISPPGHSQWTSRPFKSILSGCIPVTFFREHDNPWQDEIDYSSISINIDPDDLSKLRSRLENVLVMPGKLARMRKNILKVQDYFYWSGDLEKGIEARIMHALKKRAKKLQILRG